MLVVGTFFCIINSRGVRVTVEVGVRLRVTLRVRVGVRRYLKYVSTYRPGLEFPLHRLRIFGA